MKRILISVVLLWILKVNCQENEEGFSVIGTAAVGGPLCNDSTFVYASFESGKSPEDENQYVLSLDRKFKANYNFIEIALDDDASMKLNDRSYARLSTTMENNFYISFYRDHDGVELTVKGLNQGKIPYVNSVKINNVEKCRYPIKGFFDDYLEGYKDFASVNRNKAQNTPVEHSCGQRQIDHTELIVNGLTTKPGDWPWHAAIYRLERSSLRYICGGTLVSNLVVVTAAHCVTIRGRKVSPEILNVVLGKFNLIGGDDGAEERQVYKIIVHEEFNKRYLDNDIALLKLTSEVTFTDYIQPACLWKQETSSALPREVIRGTVVGWGFDLKDTLSSQLQMAVLPILPDIECIRNNYVFYGKVLNGKKFCAGYQNGTSPCNGDSGGGFTVFVPDSTTAGTKSGAWYLRGIVSLTMSRTDVALCDPQQNAVFTDTSVYKNWINENMIDSS